MCYKLNCLVMEDLFGTQLISKSGIVPVSVLSSIKYVLVYFSASWCKPCQSFTPALDMFYDSINSFDKDVEIIYISRDNTLEEFTEYYSKMPWLAVPYEDSSRRQTLKEIFNSKSIPSLYLINSAGSIKKEDCVQDVKNKGPLCINEWNIALSS